VLLRLDKGGRNGTARKTTFNCYWKSLESWVEMKKISICCKGHNYESTILNYKEELFMFKENGTLQTQGPW
jgi:hypothetical protein